MARAGAAADAIASTTAAATDAAAPAAGAADGVAGEVGVPQEAGLEQTGRRGEVEHALEAVALADEHGEHGQLLQAVERQGGLADGLWQSRMGVNHAGQVFTTPTKLHYGDGFCYEI